MVIIRFRRTAGNEDISVPKYQTEGAIAFDLHAAVKEITTLEPGEFKLIPAGFQMEIPRGFVAEITPRSGLAAKHGISIVNSPGLIDPDYRGEVGIVLINLGKEDFVVKRNERIAQMNIKKVERAEFVEEKDLSKTARGEGGFGSTGK
ncbi:MAG: dUTP diphosphatase [archaeon]